jgi:hypothetical protein
MEDFMELENLTPTWTSSGCLFLVIQNLWAMKRPTDWQEKEQRDWLSDSSCKSLYIASMRP